MEQTSNYNMSEEYIFHSTTYFSDYLVDFIIGLGLAYFKFYIILCISITVIFVAIVFINTFLN